MMLVNAEGGGEERDELIFGVMNIHCGSVSASKSL